MFEQEDAPVFETYNDHRMAMAFAPLSLLGSVGVQDPNVISKSYPNYWKDLIKLGFQMETN
jgi:3-phosphoshikimate 1-carboxyvinyltransferase